MHVHSADAGSMGAPASHLDHPLSPQCDVTFPPTWSIVPAIPQHHTHTNLFVTLPLAGLTMVVMDERAPSFLEKFAVKAKKEPLVPIGALATVGFLVSGMYPRHVLVGFGCDVRRASASRTHVDKTETTETTITTVLCNGVAGSQPAQKPQNKKQQ